MLSWTLVFSLRLVIQRNHENNCCAQIQEMLPFQEEGSSTQEPLVANTCLFCFNNIETYNSEVDMENLLYVLV